MRSNFRMESSSEVSAATLVGTASETHRSAGQVRGRARLCRLLIAAAFAAGVAATSSATAASAEHQLLPTSLPGAVVSNSHYQTPNVLAPSAIQEHLRHSMTSLFTLPTLYFVQDDEDQEEQQEQEELSDEEKLKKYRGRLPNYFGRVVNDTQRAEIYSIQARFNEQIADLEAQVESLAKQRDEQVVKILTPEQLEEVERYREEASKRRGIRNPREN